MKDMRGIDIKIGQVIAYGKSDKDHPIHIGKVVLDLCNKYNEVLVNDGKAPPLIRPKCKQELDDKEEQKK